MREARIAPGLLIAMPQLLDPNFEKSVVLMIEHGEEGSFGLVLNRPGPITVARFLENFELPWLGDPEAQVGIGGPVMAGTGWLIHEPISGLLDDPGTREVAAGIQLSMSLSQLQNIARRPPRLLRVVLGYAGWGPGQLEQEVVGGAWLHAEATPAMVFDTPAERLWQAALDSIGVDPAALMPTQGLN